MGYEGDSFAGEDLRGVGMGNIERGSKRRKGGD
jgi:hypothetical protein